MSGLTPGQIQEGRRLLDDMHATGTAESFIAVDEWGAENAEELLTEVESLRAQLAAREQERDEARGIARQLHKIHSRCLDKKSVHDYIRFDADRDVIASWPSVPPQTTETRG